MRDDTTIEIVTGSEPVMLIPGGATLQDVFNVPELPHLLHQTLSGWISWQQRTSSTVEQALRAARLTPEFVAALHALAPRVIPGEEVGTLGMAEAMKRKGEWFQGQWQLAVPVGTSNRVTAFEAVSITPADHPIVSAACVVDYSGDTAVRVGLTVVGVQRGGAVQLDTGDITGTRLSEGVLDAYVDGIKFPKNNLMDNYKASRDYRLAAGKVVLRKALEACTTGWRQI